MTRKVAVSRLASRTARHASVAPPVSRLTGPPSNNKEPAPAPLSIKLALRRAPFISFAKTVPHELPYYDPAKDFTYSFVNDMMASWSGKSPERLTSGDNAASAFPDSFKQYFEDDVDVSQNFAFPLVKQITEGWQPPHMETMVNMRKTLVHHGGIKWVLGCGAPFDEIELGVARFKASKLSPPCQPLADVPDDWYDLAWAELPQAAFWIKNTDDPTIVAPNHFANVLLSESDLETVAWARDAGCPWDDDSSCVTDAGDRPLTKIIQSCLEKIRRTPHAECWEFGSLRFGDHAHQLMRAWVWRPLASEPTLAWSMRPHLETVPREVREKLILGSDPSAFKGVKPNVPVP